MKRIRIGHAARRRALLQLVASVAAAPGGVNLLVAQVLAQGTDGKQGVNRMRGKVRVNGQPVKPGAAVKPGDTVSTGARSYVTFVVGSDAFLLRGNSKLELGGSGTLVNLARVITGKLLSVYAKSTQPRRIEGLTATIGVRGTGAYIEVQPERTYFCLCYGEAEIVPSALPQEKEMLRTLHHDQPRFIYGAKAKRVIEKAPVINHTDEELILLESLVGREPPFVGTEAYKSGARY